MPKIFDRPDSAVRSETGAFVRVDEDKWFRDNQAELLMLADSVEGRALLCIDPSFPQIHEIAKNFVKHYFRQGRRWHVLADFRVGAKWANVVRSRWAAFQQARRRIWLVENMGRMSRFMGVVEAVDALNGRGEVWTSAPVRRSLVLANTLTAYPDPHPESTTVDGQVFRQQLGEYFPTAAAGVGTFCDDSVSERYITGASCYSTCNINSLYRGIFLFVTSSIGASSSIISATHSFWPTDVTSTWGTSVPKACVVSSNPASNTGLAAADYQTVGTTLFSDEPLLSSIGIGAYKVFMFNAAGKAAIAKAGISKFAMTESAYDRTRTPPAEGVGGNRFTIYGILSEGTGTANDPKLVVEYALPENVSINLII